jgi:hypothetical protein
MMKKLTQIVALMVVMLVAGQSALAEAPCSEWLRASCGHDAGCCKAAGDSSASQMSMDCHGSSRPQTMSAGCGVSGCRTAMGRVVAPAVITRAFKSHRAAAAAAMTELPIANPSRQTVAPVDRAAAPGPARYLLYQVFRI